MNVYLNRLKGPKMSERDEMLIALVKEVLGPRGGPHEFLEEGRNPYDEYITGVLAPSQDAQSSDDIDGDIDTIAEEISGGVSGEENDDVKTGMVVPGSISPALDPRALPRSIGLTFTLESPNGTPKIEICVTWAHYRPEGDGWQRYPTSLLTGPVQAGQQRQNWESPSGQVRIRIRSREIAKDCWRFSVYLINASEWSGHGRAETELHVFQPQIRVHCSENTRPVPVRTLQKGNTGDLGATSMEEERVTLEMLYRQRRALARGHLCGAIWREIDPERPHDDISHPSEAPFAWTDADIVPESERSKFYPADLRTELVPCYPIESPKMKWRDYYGPAPELSTSSLSQAWKPERFAACLRPLVDGYYSWIEDQEFSIEKLQDQYNSAANIQIQRCKDAAKRIEEAIDILTDDEDARLAFCFANKAIALQSKWTRGDPITWRPFQVAFILLNIPSLVDPLHSDREICDLLWFPTGGGKTEAYLGLAAFTLGLRRLRAFRDNSRDSTGGGVSVLSRYTLRLLSIQQFRRALGLITACEMLRVHGLDTPEGPVGWRPLGCSEKGSFIWGELRFSAGLWVGGGVTPNNLFSIGPIPMPGKNGFKLYVGALDILKGASNDKDYQGPDKRLRKKIRNSRELEIRGEPAQILTCPCCNSTLAVPKAGFEEGKYSLHFVFRSRHATRLTPKDLEDNELSLTINRVKLTQHESSQYYTISVEFKVSEGSHLSPNQVDQLWYKTIAPNIGKSVQLMAARPARPGYFILTYDNSQNHARQCGFDIYCPNPECELNQHAWSEQVPLARTVKSAENSSSRGVFKTERTAALPLKKGFQWQETPEWCRRGKTRWIANRIPVPALTVDDQVYHRCPSLVIATVDKFARLAFEPKAAAIFGNVTHYHSRWGYYREKVPPLGSGSLPSGFRSHPPGYSRGKPLHKKVSSFLPPELILQDELHLIEGPLGSMVGLYETAIDLLCQRQLKPGTKVGPKYIASTATVRQAESQVQAIFDRRLAQFPPWATTANDRFFSRNEEVHPLDSERPGRLYVAISAPGKGAQTPIVRIWSSLLQKSWERWQIANTKHSDNFYTLVGYFNAIRELAGALSLYRQDIPERMHFRVKNTGNVRRLDRRLELSSRVDSLDLPSKLESLAVEAPDAYDAVFATSMFGTGVDVNRLGLMVVHGQPKTTASYIQATGRVGRQRGGLIVTFFRASRPRDLDHYEFFTGYHRELYRLVEPITVAPFSPRARERALGPLATILLRQADRLGDQPVHEDWRVQQRINGGFYAMAHRMAEHRYDLEVAIISEIFEERAAQQPDGRRPPSTITEQETCSKLDRWAMLAKQNPHPDAFVYYEPAVNRSPERDVVLGDPQHNSQNVKEVYRNAPQSLREVEETTAFKV
jgi:hypothetical protein